MDTEPHSFFPTGSGSTFNMPNIAYPYSGGENMRGKTQKCQEIVSNCIFLKLSKLGPTPLFFTVSFEQSFFCLFELGNLFQFF